MNTDTNGSVSPVPAGYATVTPWLITDDTAAFVEFLSAVFGAEERFPPVYADESMTRIAHAEVAIGDSVIMLFDRAEGWMPTPGFLNVYVTDCDDVHARALAAGAVEVTPLSTNAWGDRGSRVRDPFGNLWWIQTRVEEVDDDEIERRMGEPRFQRELAVAMETLDRAMRRAGPVRRVT